MSWARFDDQFHDDPDIDMLCDSAIALHVTGVTWCCRNETDGAIPKARVRKLSGGSNPEAIKDLKSVGWWEETETHFVIRSFLKYNRSKEQMDNERKTTASRVQKWRTGSNSNSVTSTVTYGDSNGTGNGECNSVNNDTNQAVTNGSVTHASGPDSRLPDSDSESPTQTPVPGTDVSATKKRPDIKTKPRNEAFERCWTAYGRCGIKAEALVEWLKEPKGIAEVEAILSFIDKANEVGLWAEGYKKHFNRFLKSKMWESDLDGLMQAKGSPFQGRYPQIITSSREQILAAIKGH